MEPADTTEAIVALYRDEVARSRAILAGAALDAPAAHPKAGRSLRWIVAYMVYEVSRHCGYADILREQIDGRTRPRSDCRAFGVHE